MPRILVLTLGGLLAAAVVVAGPEVGLAQDNKWGFGADVGFLSGTVDNTVFALSLSADYYFDPAFSVGPMVLLAPAGDLTQVAFAGVARYHFRLQSFNIVPFAGVGFVHASLERGSGPGRIDTNDTSYYIPLGITAEYQATRKLAFATTLMFNLHNLSMDPPVGRDTLDIAVLFGFRFGP